MTTSITQLRFCQVPTEEVETATKLLAKAKNQLRNVPEVLPQQSTDLETVSEAQKAILLLPRTDIGSVENQNRFCQKFTRSYLTPKRKRKVHEVSKPMASLSLIPFPFAFHSLSSSWSAVTHENTINQNKDERCLTLTLHRFTSFHLEPRMRNIPVF